MGHPPMSTTLTNKKTLFFLLIALACPLAFTSAHSSPRDNWATARSTKPSGQRRGSPHPSRSNPSTPSTLNKTAPFGQDSPYWSRARIKTSLSMALESTRFGKRFSRSLSSLLIRRIPLVPRNDATLPWLDPLFFEKFGVPLGPFGLVDPAHEKRILGEIALRPVKTGERPTRHAEATRYSDEGIKTVISNEGDGGGVRQGRWVVGDGRAGVIGAPLMRQRPNGRGGWAVEFSTLRVKGIPTGLKPLQDWNDVHTTGNQGDRWAAMEVVISQFLHSNGIKVNRIPALATTRDSFAIEMYGFRSIQNKAFELNAGHFDRLAHLNEVRQSPRAMSEFLAQINALVCAELGRKRPLSLAELFQHLVRRKAREVADMYWTRAAHGSPTFDNIGLLQTIDVASVTPVDRAHPHYATLRGVSDGFAAEPRQFLAPYSEFLFSRLIEVASPRQRATLRRIRPRALIERELQRRMEANALEHMGVDLDAISWLMKRARPEVTAFIRAVRRFGEQAAPGAVAIMGAAVKTEVKDPARYNIFSGLSRLATIWGSGAPREAQLTALATALQPVDGEWVRDRRAAAALLDAAGPLLARLTVKASAAQRGEIIKLMADQAGRLNEPIDDMVRSSLDAWGKELYHKVSRGLISRVRFRGEINARTRDNIRRGPLSVSHMVKRIREGKLERDGTRGFILSRIDEHGVRIEEISAGRRQLARFSIAAEALERGRIKTPRLRYSLDGKTWATTGPTRTTREGVVIFEVPVSSAPTCIQGRFIDARRRNRSWDLGGMAFGVGHRPLLASAAVKAALISRQRPRTGGSAHDLTTQAAHLMAKPWSKQP